jgi:hypothetical protein
MSTVGEDFSEKNKNGNLWWGIVGDTLRNDQPVGGNSSISCC